MGKKILVLKNVGKAYDDKVLIKDVTYTFSRFEKAGLIGKNGQVRQHFSILLQDCLN